MAKSKKFSRKKFDALTFEEKEVLAESIGFDEYSGTDDGEDNPSYRNDNVLYEELFESWSSTGNPGDYITIVAKLN